MISWGGVYYAATAHPKQYFCPLSSRHRITHGGGRTPNSVVRNELLQPCFELNSKYRNTKVQLNKVNTGSDTNTNAKTLFQFSCKERISSLQGGGQRSISMPANRRPLPNQQISHLLYWHWCQVLIFVLIPDRETPIPRWNCVCQKWQNWLLIITLSWGGYSYTGLHHKGTPSISYTIFEFALLFDIMPC